MNRIVRGSLAGLGATAPMTAVMFAGDALGLLRTPPPKHITARAGQKADVPTWSAPAPAFQTAWLAAHVGYGTVCGALYGLVRPLLPKNRLLSGLLYGGSVWAVNYLAVLPALHLFPSPLEAPASESALMLAAHGVYGTSLAELERLLPPD